MCIREFFNAVIEVNEVPRTTGVAHYLSGSAPKTPGALIVLPTTHADPVAEFAMRTDLPTLDEGIWPGVTGIVKYMVCGFHARCVEIQGKRCIPMDFSRMYVVA